MLENKRVALVHDWLTGMRGGEYVLEALCDLLPHAEIYTLVHIAGSVSPAIEKHRIHTSPLQKCPGIGRFYRHLLPFMPWAIEQFDLKKYDLIVSSSHCVAKGAIPGPRTRHLCYCHTPMRYIWDQYDQYFGPGRASLPAQAAMKVLLPHLRKWDLRSSTGVHRFVANSRHVAGRIRRIYNRGSDVVHPPVDVHFYQPADSTEPSDDFDLIVSAFAPYKRVDVAIRACQLAGRRLVVIGEGQESAQLRRLAGPRTEFLGWQSREVLRDHYRNCRLLLFPGEEDFGIVPVEVQACGRPVLAYAKGGALETVKEEKTGLYFSPQTPEAMAQKIQEAHRHPWNSREIRSHAEQFSLASFHNRISQILIEFTS